MNSSFASESNGSYNSNLSKHHLEMFYSHSDEKLRKSSIDKALPYINKDKLKKANLLNN